MFRFKAASHLQEGCKCVVSCAQNMEDLISKHFYEFLTYFNAHFTNHLTDILATLYSYADKTQNRPI
jgi:hypothetical protein